MRGVAVWRSLILLGTLGRCAPFRVSPHSVPARRAALRLASCPSAPLRGCGMLGRGAIGAARGGPARAPRVYTVGHPPFPAWRPSVPLGLQMMAGHDAMDRFADDLLCQRAVQTQLYYFQEFRDGFKKQWLENFLDHGGLMNFHGFGGLNVPADEYLNAMMNSPPQEHEVVATWGNRLAGGSKDNPFLQNKPKFNSYTETVHPQKICKGLMEIREQLQLEWVTDLPVMEEEDALFRLAVKKLEAAENAALDPPTEYRLGADGKSAKPVVGDKNARHNLPPDVYDDPLAWLPPSLDGDVPEGLEEFAQQERAAEATGGMMQFDASGVTNSPFSLLRDDMMLLGVRGDQSSTPLRAKNYDVLKKAATYIAVTRLMHTWQRDQKKEGAMAWFSLQWHDKYKELLEQDSGRHLSDRFLSTLVRSPAVAVQAPKAGTLHMVTPAHLALEIIEERQLVVKGFLKYLQSTTVQDGHIQLQRQLLVRSLSGETKTIFRGREAEASDLWDENDPDREELDSVFFPKKKKDATDDSR